MWRDRARYGSESHPRRRRLVSSTAPTIAAIPPMISGVLASTPSTAGGLVAQRVLVAEVRRVFLQLGVFVH